MSGYETHPAAWSGNLSARTTALVLGLLLVVSFLAISRDVWTPDEPREAEISREMWLSPGVVPRLDGQPFIEKPPLYYWTVAGVFEIAGRASPAAARAASAVASFLTLLLVYGWGRRDFSTEVGLLAAFGLATSAQFAISSHWILIDPLLMLFATAACWSAWELIRGRGGTARAVLFYTALVLALWTKGLIGPILLGCGLLTYAVWKRSLRPIRALHPITGVTVLVAATGLFAYLVYREAGYDAVRDWFWVNHVLRFVAPTTTGHEQPLYYYLSAIPVALMPWWVPAFDVLRPSRWRDVTFPNLELRTYLAALSLGMALILSASTTKRGIYLLPMLPPLALLLAAHASSWLNRWSAGAAAAWPYWLQVGLVAAFAVVPAGAALLYFMRPDPLAIGFLFIAAVVVVAAIASARARRHAQAVLALGACGLSGVLGLFVVVVHLAAPMKDMSAFVERVDEQIPAGRPIYALGDIDETFEGIVPFVTGRRFIPLSEQELRDVAPAFVLVQEKDGGATVPDLGASYEQIDGRTFGLGRYLGIWRREDPIHVSAETTE